MIPGCVAAPSSDAAAHAADIVFLTVPDDAIATVQGGIDWKSGQLAIHCSGALPAAIFERALGSGARAAGFHPLQTFADSATGLANLPRSTIGIEADDETWPFLAELARDLSATPVRISPENRAVYHAASAILSNGTVGLMAVAAQLWAGLGIERPEAVRALLPLLQGTVRNIEALGIPLALTGPVLRGDVGTVQRHVAALADVPEEQAVYRTVSHRLIELALERGTIDDDQAQALRSILNDPPSHGG